MASLPTSFVPFPKKVACSHVIGNTTCGYSPESSIHTDNSNFAYHQFVAPVPEQPKAKPYFNDPYNPEAYPAPAAPISQNEIPSKVLKWTAPAVPNLSEPVELPYKVDGLSDEQKELLTVWENTKTQLTKLKSYEMELRKAIVYDGGFFDADKTSGTEHAALGDGYKLTSVKKETYTLKNENGETDAALTLFTDDEAALLVKWTPTLSVSNYKKLSEEKQAFFNGALEIKDGAPTLDIKQTKKP